MVAHVVPGFRSGVSERESPLSLPRALWAAWVSVCTEQAPQRQRVRREASVGRGSSSWGCGGSSEAKEKCDCNWAGFSGPGSVQGCLVYPK